MAKRRVGFRECVDQYNQILVDVKSRRFAPIYMLMGEESYFIDQLSDLLATTVLSEAEQAFNQITLYGRDCDAGAVINAARQVPMMGGQSVIIVREAQMMRSIEKLAIYAASPVTSTILVICHKEKCIDKRSTLYKNVSKCGVVFESITPRDYEIGGWLTHYLSGRGLSLNTKALAMLTESLGTSIAKIESEVSKLIVALPAGTQIISDDDIERYIGISKEFNNFELCNAIVSRNLERSLRIANHMAQNPKSYPLLLTIIVLFNQFKQMFTFNYLRWLTQHRGATFPSDGELMRILKINNPYGIADLKRICGVWPNRKVFFILGLMREYDAKSKGIDKGSSTDGELLRELILKIFAA